MLSRLGGVRGLGAKTALLARPVRLQARTLRTKPDSHSSSAGKDDSQSSEERPGDEEAERKQKWEQAKAEFKKLNPADVRRLRLFGLATFATSAVLSYVLLKRTLGREGAVPGGEQVPFQEFVDKFLKAGEVRSLVYMPGQRVAMATLYEGAMIDGRPWPGTVVLVQYEAEPGADPAKFEADVRRVEESLGVQPHNRVHVRRLEGMSTRKTLELLLGLGILLFLFTQYGRLIRRKVLAERAAKKSD